MQIKIQADAILVFTMVRAEKTEVVMPGIATFSELSTVYPSCRADCQRGEESRRFPRLTATAPALPHQR
jgi:hypothetical protein